jgi:hypothetical protein
MIVYSLLLVTLLLACTSIFLVWQVRSWPVMYSWHRVLLSLVLGVFVYLYGAWVFLSVYMKFVFALCFIIIFIASLLRKKTAGNKTRPKVVSLAFTAILIALSVLYFTGTTGTPYGIANLAFPFKKGAYLIFQGGKGLPTNIFHFGLRGAVYAIDIVKLNRAGNRANHVFSTNLHDYEIYGDTIFSPCSGIVLRAKSDNPDNIPPHRDRGPSNTNQVLIETDSFYVFLGHIQHGKVFVQEGQFVSQGQPLGLVGNSGFSLEPHLHIQVHAKTNKDIPWYKERPLLIEFNGRSYLLFEEIKANGMLTKSGIKV